MKAIYKILILLSIIISSTSCEEVVILNLRTAEPKNVADAYITEGSPCYVLLTKSQGFQDNSPYEKISNAVVRLTNSRGKTEILEESGYGTGLYVSEMLGEVNYTYQLEIQIDEEIYKASATIPEIVYIDRVYIYEITAGTKSWYSPAITFQDPPYKDNYYYAILSVNDKVLRTIYLFDDEHTNGDVNDEILFFDKEENNDEDLQTGDVIRVELQNLDKGMYTFYKSLYSVAEGTNAISNFSGGILGCFKAYNSSISEAIVSQDIVEPAN